MVPEVYVTIYVTLHPQHMEAPSPDVYTVYTKSGCGHCRRVKDSLPESTIYINCDEILARDRDAFLQRMDQWSQTKQRTFPFVFHKGSFIGGREDTERYVAFQDADF